VVVACHTASMFEEHTIYVIWRQIVARDRWILRSLARFTFD
jgi:hypothetical protein